MKTKQIKTIKGLSIAAIVFVMLGAWSPIQTLLKGFNGPIPFEEKFITLPKFFIITYGISGIAVVVLFLLWIINTWKGIKQGNIFPRINAGIAYLCGIFYLIYGFCQSNINETFRRGEFSVTIIDTDTILVPLVIFIFATLYKIASIASEENNLTI